MKVELLNCKNSCARPLPGERKAIVSFDNNVRWEDAIDLAKSQGLLADGLCTNWDSNGAEGKHGWCFRDFSGTDTRTSLP